MRVVVDTSVMIDYLRRRSAQTSLYASLIGKAGMVLSLISVAELYSGKSAWRNEEQRKLVEDMLSGVEIIVPTIGIAKEAGRLRLTNQLTLPDAFIASLALDLVVPLVTLNTSDFQRIKGLKLYPSMS